MKRYATALLWALADLACIAILVAPAIWNGFPLLQYDTGGYLAPWFEGKLEINRSVPYGLLLVAGRWPDFWPVLIVQSALTVWVLALTLRAHGLRRPAAALLRRHGRGAVGSHHPAWLTAILLTDIFAGLSVLALYLLLLRDDALSAPRAHGAGRADRGRRRRPIARTMVMLLGLIAPRHARLADRQRAHALCAPAARACRLCCSATLMVVAANGAGHRQDTPGRRAATRCRSAACWKTASSSDISTTIARTKPCGCARTRTQLPHDADDFFWGEGVFDKLGRFDGMRDEMKRIALDSLADYPLAADQVGRHRNRQADGRGRNRRRRRQLDLEHLWPDRSPRAGRGAGDEGGAPAARSVRLRRHQRVAGAGRLVRHALLPVIAVVGLRRAATRRRRRIGRRHDAGDPRPMPACSALLATAHHRYGARMVWLAVFAVALALVRLYQRRDGARCRPRRQDILRGLKPG